MSKVLSRAWRILATAVAFSTFGVGGLLMRLILFPALRLLVWDARQQARLARLAIHFAMAGFIQLMRGLGILTYHISGVEKLARPGLLVLANHPTLIDVVFLISLLRDADCVVKASLARNPFTRGPVRSANYLFNDSGAGLVDDCIASVKAGHKLVIFPEGTRTRPGCPLKLQRGAANIAVRGAIDITPVIIDCTPISLTKGNPWWKVPVRRMHFTIRVEDDIAIAPFLEAAEHEPSRAARQLTEFLTHYFSRETPPHANA